MLHNTVFQHDPDNVVCLFPRENRTDRSTDGHGPAYKVFFVQAEERRTPDTTTEYGYHQFVSVGIIPCIVSVFQCGKDIKTGLVIVRTVSGVIFSALFHLGQTLQLTETNKCL